MRELRVERGAGGGTAVIFRVAGAGTAAGSLGVTLRVEVLRTTEGADLVAAALAVAAFALLTMLDSIPEAPPLVGELCIDFTGETGRAS